ncbi:MAG: hypothetical protein D6761_04675 [Candidatus Dadabacteria bacterium]|nr:MAG: hypothetical protein D6761_04675 [Candidatus Dadabacteria bacterium]
MSFRSRSCEALAQLLLIVLPLLVAGCGRSGEIELVTGIRVQTTTIDALANPGFFGDLAIDPIDGQPAVAYYVREPGDLRYAKLEPGTGQWVIEDVDTDGDVGGYPQLEFTQTGRPHIAYYDFTNGRIKYALFNGLEWERQSIPLATETEGFLSMRLDRNDIAHISTIDVGNFNLQYLVYDPQSRALGGLTVDDGTLTSGKGGNINSRMSIELREGQGGLALPVIAYYNASLGVLNLTWMVDNGGALEFVPPRTIDGRLDPNASDVGQWVSTTLSDYVDVNGNAFTDDVVHMSYYDASNADLKYASFRFSTTETVIERVDRDGIVGETSSITIDRQGRPTISYYDSTNNDLKVAFRLPDGRWFDKRVDLKGIVGSFSSIALLPGDGDLGIAYRDSGREALKFSVVSTN